MLTVVGFLHCRLRLVLGGGFFYCSATVVKQWLDAGARQDRIMFGSDLPVQQQLFDLPLTDYLRKTIRGFTSSEILYNNFKDFLAK